MTKEQDILNDLVTAVRNDVIHSLQANGREATGATIKELQQATINNKVMLLAPSWITALENGRKPTPEGTPPSDPTLREALIPWLDARGIPQSAAYAVAKKIHQKGYKGTPGVLSEPLSDDNINRLADQAADNLATLLITSTLKF